MDQPWSKTVQRSRSPSPPIKRRQIKCDRLPWKTQLMTLTVCSVIWHSSRLLTSHSIRHEWHLHFLHVLVFRKRRAQQALRVELAVEYPVLIFSLLEFWTWAIGCAKDHQHSVSLQSSPRHPPILHRLLRVRQAHLRSEHPRKRSLQLVHSSHSRPQIPQLYHLKQRSNRSDPRLNPQHHRITTLDLYLHRITAGPRTCRPPALSRLLLLVLRPGLFPRQLRQYPKPHGAQHRR